VHFFPSFFVFFLVATLISNLLSWPLADLCNFILSLYIILLISHAWLNTKSLKVALLAVVASFIQLIAYGFGFIQDYFKFVILNRELLKLKH
jgi:hypothetical protein